jgi:hypothetical protein
MKKIFLLSLLVTAVTVTNCGNVGNNTAGASGTGKDSTGIAEIVFREYEHDFGKVTEGEKVAYVFTFDNKGTGDLIVKYATTSCGCTVPKYDTKPISPGGSGSMEVVFDTSEKNGMQTKTITVKSNASKPVVLLKITAEVVTNNN